jgi:four helix bundle protein
MKIQRFEDLIAWQKAQDFAVEIYNLFNGNKDWDFRNQICRASVSVSNNIAEGFDRLSRAEFRRFLLFSLASCSEVKSMIYLAKRLGYLNAKNEEILLAKAFEISKIITGLIKYLESKKPIRLRPS